MFFLRFVLLATLASGGEALTAQNTSSFLATGNLDVDRAPRVFYPFSVPKTGYKTLESFEIAATADVITALTLCDRADGAVEMRASVQDYLFSTSSLLLGDFNMSTCMANASSGEDWESGFRDMLTAPIIKVANTDGTLKELPFNEELNSLADWLINEFPAPSQQEVARSLIQPIQDMLNSTWYSIIKNKALKPGDTEVVAQEHPFGVIHEATTLLGYSLYEKVDCAVFSTEGSCAFDVETAFKALSDKHLTPYLAGIPKNSTEELIWGILFKVLHVQVSGTLYFDYVNEVVLKQRSNFTASFELFGDTPTQAFHFYTSQTSEILEYPSFINASDVVNLDSAPKLRFRPQIRRMA
ncbi:MAG: hypothetical protein SGARI_002233 [Bacillariaceae sp.]